MVTKRHVTTCQRDNFFGFGCFLRSLCVAFAFSVRGKLIKLQYVAAQPKSPCLPPLASTDAANTLRRISTNRHVGRMTGQKTRHGTTKFRPRRLARPRAKARRQAPDSTDSVALCSRPKKFARHPRPHINTSLPSSSSQRFMGAWSALMNRIARSSFVKIGQTQGRWHLCRTRTSRRTHHQGGARHLSKTSSQPQKTNTRLLARAAWRTTSLVYKGYTDGNRNRSTL